MAPDPFKFRVPTRRAMLLRSANGFGVVALATLLAEDGRAADPTGRHHPVRAKSVIFLYMDGGPSQIDTFDYKPLLDKYDGRAWYPSDRDTPIENRVAPAA